MAHVVNGLNLYAALLAEGFKVPEECAEVQLTMPADGLFQLHWIVNVRSEDLAALGRVMTRLGRVDA